MLRLLSVSNYSRLRKLLVVSYLLLRVLRTSTRPLMPAPLFLLLGFRDHP